MAWPTTSRHERGYGNDWVKRRLRILDRDRRLCQPCKRKGRVTVAREVNHKTPKAKGGTDDDDNLESICTPCHKVETAKQNAEAQGRTYRPRAQIGNDGWPVEER